MKYWFTTQTPYVMQQKGLWVRPKYLNTIHEIRLNDEGMVKRCYLLQLVLSCNNSR